MNIKCTNLSELKCFSDIKLAAGAGGLDHSITWVYICQGMQIGEWIHGGELVFAAFTESGCAEEILLRMLRECSENAAAGLVVLMNDGSDIPKSVLETADKENMPLYIMPWELKLVDVTKEIADTIIMNQLLEKSSAGFFSELLFSRNYSYAAVRQMGIHCGADTDSPAAIMILRPDFAGSGNYRRNDYDNAVKSLCKSIEQTLDILKISFVSCVYMNEIFLYINCTDSASASQICEKLRGVCDNFSRKNPYNIFGGMGRAAGEIDGLRKSYAEARQSFSAAEKSKKPVNILFYSELGILRLLIDNNNQNELREYCISVLKPLAESDRKSGTDYVNTLEIYLQKNCSLVEAAEALYIHRNTMVYRIARIKELLNMDFTDMNAKTECMNALHIMRHFDIDISE